jgi:serine/threonine-protein kinase
MLNKFSYFWTLPFVSFLLGYGAMSYVFSVESVATPSVIGLQLTDAFELLSANNLNPRLLAKNEEPDVAPGTILNQNPQQGTKIKPNQSVFLVVAIKPAPVKAPALVNTMFSDSTRQPKSQDLHIKTYSIDNEAYPKGYCIGQHPEQGQTLTGKNIIAYMSSGAPKPLLLPNFKGKSVPDVLEVLTVHGIRPSIVHTDSDKEKHTCDKQCIVHDQRPSAGTILTIDPSKPVQLQLQV